jgi:hypothetical protein
LGVPHEANDKRVANPRKLKGRAMKASRFLRDALRLCAATAILAGCGGQAGNSVVPIGDARNALSHHKSFFYTGAAQDFTVRRHVKQIKVIALGANGAGTYDGHGGRVSAQLTVNPGERLAIYVGGNASGSSGGYNGGGNGGGGQCRSGCAAHRCCNRAREARQYVKSEDRERLHGANEKIVP